MINVTIFKKMYHDHWKSLLSWSLVIIFMATIQLLVYPSIVKSGEAAKQFINSYPEAIKKMFRMEDYTSGAGFLGTELFSMMVPLVMIGIGVIWGAAASAEDEEQGTADFLFVLPIRRATILLSRLLATVLALIGLAVITFLNIFLLEGSFNLKVNTLNLAAACITQFFLGFYFSGVGVILGSISGNKGLSLGIGSGIGIIFFLFFSLAPLVDTFDYTNSINPFEWAIAKNSLTYGFDIPGIIKLGILGIVFYIGSILIIERREIHS